MPFDVDGFVWITVLLSVLVPVAITVGVIAFIFWTIRRVLPTGKAAARNELDRRLASGQISPTEYQARLDALEAER